MFLLFLLALLAGTLRTYQRAGCDHEFVQLGCPRGTTISIEFAQYGKYGGEGSAGLCPETTEETETDKNVINSGTEIEVKSEKCMWPQALQVSIIYHEFLRQIWQIIYFRFAAKMINYIWGCRGNIKML